MRQTPSTTQARARGFTLTELIVVISIIVLIIGILFPVMSAMTGSSRVEAGLNTVGMSADVARQWVASQAWENDGSSTAGAPVFEQYNGTAALFCPNGEIRIVVNFAGAKDGTDFLEDVKSIPSALAKNGYRNHEGIDFISIPNDVGVVGIYRDGSLAANAKFIAPPFAIAFNEKGHLNFGDSNGRIFYDANGNDSYNRLQVRAAGYNPGSWDGGESASNSGFISSTKPYRALPFEAIECVPGVLVYDGKAYKAAEPYFPDGSGLKTGGVVTLASDAGQWLQENGRVLMFSPQTGIALRDED